MAPQVKQRVFGGTETLAKSLILNGLLKMADYGRVRVPATAAPTRAATHGMAEENRRRVVAQAGGNWSCYRTQAGLMYA
jgi:hypothetical protein